MEILDCLLLTNCVYRHIRLRRDMLKQTYMRSAKINSSLRGCYQLSQLTGKLGWYASYPWCAASEPAFGQDPTQVLLRAAVVWDQYQVLPSDEIGTFNSTVSKQSQAAMALLKSNMVLVPLRGLLTTRPSFSAAFDKFHVADIANLSL